MNEHMNVKINKQMDKWISELINFMNEWMNQYIDGWRNKEKKQFDKWIQLNQPDVSSSTVFRLWKLVFLTEVLLFC